MLFSGPANCAKKGLSAGCPVNPYLSEGRYGRKIKGVPGPGKMRSFFGENEKIRKPGGRETAGMVSGRRVIHGYGLSHVRIVTEAHRLDNPRF